MGMAITTVPIKVLDEGGLPRYRALKTELADLRLSNQELVQEITEMKREIGGLRSDPSSVERIARDELGMVRPDEYVFQFDGE